MNFFQVIPVDRLIQAKYQDNLEFMQWMKRYYDLNAPGEYDGLARCVIHLEISNVIFMWRSEAQIESECSLEYSEFLVAQFFSRTCTRTARSN